VELSSDSSPSWDSVYLRHMKVFTRNEGDSSHVGSYVSVRKIAINAHTLRIDNFLYQSNVNVVFSEEIHEHSHSRWGPYAVYIDAGDLKYVHAVSVEGVIYVIV
jgi:hypothetical protein